MTLEKQVSEILKRQIKIEELLEQVLCKKEWISESEACLMLHRSKVWLQIQRNGLKGMPPTLTEGRDWKKGMNGRTIEYRRRSLESLKQRKFLKT